MGRYFFTLLTDLEVPDLIGKEAKSFPDLHRLAFTETRNLAAEDVLSGVVDLSHGVRVEDQTGQEVLTMRLSHALKLGVPGRERSLA